MVSYGSRPVFAIVPIYAYEKKKKKIVFQDGGGIPVKSTRGVSGKKRRTAFNCLCDEKKNSALQ